MKRTQTLRPFPLTFVLLSPRSDGHQRPGGQFTDIILGYGMIVAIMMIHVCGVLVDHLGRILLTKDTETNTLTPPGHGLCQDELPDQALVEAMRESTGLIVMPVRVTGVTFGSRANLDRLTICFRCIMRGGELEQHDEHPQNGFFDAIPLPRPMLQHHRQQIDLSIHHAGGPPFSVREAVDWRGRLKLRRKKNRRIYDWDASVVLIVATPDNKVLWHQGTDDGRWFLPETKVSQREAPWEAVTRHLQTWPGFTSPPPVLRGMYLLQGTNHIVFSYLLAPVGLDTVASKGLTLFEASEAPSDSPASHQNMVADALSFTEGVTCRMLAP